MDTFEIWCEAPRGSVGKSSTVVWLEAVRPPSVLWSRMTRGKCESVTPATASTAATNTSPETGSTAMPVRPFSPEPGKLPTGSKLSSPVA